MPRTRTMYTAEFKLQAVRMVTDQKLSVAGGAVRRGDEWIVAHGIHDHWCDLHSFSHADLESRLVEHSGLMPRRSP